MSNAELYCTQYVLYASISNFRAVYMQRGHIVHYTVYDGI